MPIPTDTYWNIKRLNVVFAVSAVLLLAVTGGAILQDYNQGWREPQRDGKVWDAALVREKIDADITPDKAKRIDELKAEIEKQKAELAPRQKEIADLQGQVRTLESDQSNME